MQLNDDRDYVLLGMYIAGLCLIIALVQVKNVSTYFSIIHVYVYVCIYVCFVLSVYLHSNMYI